MEEYGGKVVSYLRGSVLFRWFYCCWFFRVFWVNNLFNLVMMTSMSLTWISMVRGGKDFRPPFFFLARDRGKEEGKRERGLSF